MVVLTSKNYILLCIRSPYIVYKSKYNLIEKTKIILYDKLRLFTHIYTINMCISVYIKTNILSEHFKHCDLSVIQQVSNKCLKMYCTCTVKLMEKIIHQ